MKQIQQFIIFLLCTTVLGLFANWAQNDYAHWIISVSLFLISLLFLLAAFLVLRGYKFFQISFGVLVLLLPILPIVDLIQSYFLQGNLELLGILLSISALCIPIAGLLLPLVMFIKQVFRKSRLPLIDFTFYLYPALYTAGIAFKLNQFPGANFLFILSGLIIIPLLVQAVLFLKESRNRQTRNPLPAVLLCLLIGTCWLGTLFKVMHWPGAGILAAISIFLLPVLIIIFIYSLFKPGIVPEIMRLNWHLRTFGIVFIFISIYGVLSIWQIAPAYYSTEYPPALQELISRSDDVTEQGRKNSKQAQIYRENYRRFIWAWTHSK